MAQISRTIVNAYLPIGGEPDEVKHLLSDVDADHHW